MKKRIILSNYLSSALNSYFHEDIDNYSKNEIELLFIMFLNKNIIFRSSYLFASINYHFHTNQLDFEEFFVKIVNDLEFDNQKFIEIKIGYTNYFLFNPAFVSLYNGNQIFISEHEVFKNSVMRR